MSQESTVLTSVRLGDDPALQTALFERADVFAMTQAAEEAVLRPVQPGGLSHELRHALAARIAAQNGLADLAARYAGGAGSELQPICDPAHLPEGKLRVIASFMDDVACNPRDVTADDVTHLQEGGTSDADIVRLAELNAFMAYQCRLVTGLRLMAGGVA